MLCVCICVSNSVYTCNTQDFATQGDDDEDNQAMLSDLVFMADSGGEHKCVRGGNGGELE